MQRLFGPIMQNAFVVDDLEAAIEHWAGRLGVGPFFVFEHIQFTEILFRGEPTACDMTAAIAYWGDLQIELIQQHNDAPSIYREFTGRGSTGLQHMGVMCEDIDAQLARLAPIGIAPVQWGRLGKDARFAYVDSDRLPGTMIELIESGAGMVKFFATMKEAAVKWDGRRSIARI